MKIALIQITSELVPQKNLSKITKYLKQAKKQGAVAAFLPEVFYSLGDGLQTTPYLVMQDNEHFAAIKNLAITHKIALLGGTAATRVGNQIVNRCYNFDAEGHLLGFYDKIHMFKCLIKKPNKIIDIDETRVYSPGNRPSVIEFQNISIGLSTCFDLRYPDLYQIYKKKGVDLITASSAFTHTTGKEHWHTLVRARAIETQSFVIAVNQTGKHNEKMHSYGHSLAVDPWGRILVDMKTQEGLSVLELDFTQLAVARTRIIL